MSTQSSTCPDFSSEASLNQSKNQQGKVDSVPFLLIWENCSNSRTRRHQYSRKCHVSLTKVTRQCGQIRLRLFSSRLLLNAESTSYNLHFSSAVSDYSPPSVKHQLLTFDLSSHVTKLQSASRVQLRVFKRRSKLRDAKDLFFIHLYEVNPSTESNFSVEYQKIVSSRLVDNLHGQWLTFDVTSLVEKNTLDSTSKNFLVDVKPVSSHTTSRSVSIAKVGRKRPMLLLFYKKNLSNNEKKTKLTKMRMFSLKMARFPRDARATEGAGEYCRRHRLYIDFRVIGWSDRVIAPRGFPAYYCHGKCSMMLSQSMNPSHHSFILNLYKLFAQDDNIPSAYCVPTELKSTSLLYFDEQQNIVLKEVPDMTVTSCGCR